MRDYRENEEIKVKLIEKHLAAYQHLIDIMPEIKTVLESFDGKQVNKRIETALKKVDPQLSVENSYNTYNVNYYISDNHVSGNPDDYGVCCAYYVCDRSIIVLGGCREYGYDTEKSCIVDGKFNSNGLLHHYEDQIEYFKQMIEETKTALANMDNLIAERQHIKDEIEKYNKSFNWLINSYFELRI